MTAAKPRYDNKGDAFAELHREELPSDCYFSDIDMIFGNISFSAGTEDTLFIEYLPDDFENRNNPTREFKALALIDRKESHEAALRATIPKQLYQWLALMVTQAQKHQCRFFQAIGKDTVFDLIEYDVVTGNKILEKQIANLNIYTVWKEIGLCRM